jgi:hypothetical protein
MGNEEGPICEGLGTEEAGDGSLGVFECFEGSRDPDKTLDHFFLEKLQMFLLLVSCE